MHAVLSLDLLAVTLFLGLLALAVVTDLEAMRIRRERLEADPGRDRQAMDQVRQLEEAFLHRVEALPPGAPPGAALREVRWLLEEYRVSLFAQQLGTQGKVSDQRIRRALG